MNFLMWRILPVILTIQSCLGISFVFGPSDVTVTVGQTATLRCRVRNKGPLSVHWRNANEQRYLTADTTFYPNAVNHRYRVVGNQAIGEYFLQITNVQSSDAGQYQCVIVPNGRTVAMSANLHVNAPQRPNPEIPRCSSSPSPDSVNVGEEVTISCSSPGGVPPAQLTWLENGHTIAGPSSVHVLSHTFILEERHNGRTFSCRSTHQTFHGERLCTVVPYQRNIRARIEPPEFRGKRGKNAKFTCEVFGVSSELEYSWFFDSHPVNVWDGRFAVTGGGRILIIYNLTTEDNDTNVRCQISTIYGLTAASSGRLLVVQGADEPPMITDFTRLTFSVNTSEVYFNQTTEGLVRLQTQELVGPNSGKSSSLITVIIVVAIVISQIVFIALVYGIHRIANRMKRTRQLSSLETGVHQTGVRVANCCEISHIQSRIQQPSVNEDHRYKSLHRYDTANAVAQALSDEEARRDTALSKQQVDSDTYSFDMDDSVYHKVPSVSLDYEIPTDCKKEEVEEYVVMRPSVTSETLYIHNSDSTN